MPMPEFTGPRFRLVDTITRDGLARQGGFRPRSRPLLVKGALADWPASERWTFAKLAALRRPDGSDLETTFQNGLTEQGLTRAPLKLPLGPYLRQLDALAAQPRDGARGLVPDATLAALAPGDTFTVNWGHLDFPPDRTYLAVWYLFDDFPQLKQDLRIRSLWPTWRSTWEYAFIGPADTVTGLHNDYPDNWFCQIQGVKEFLLFPPENTRFLSPSRKFDSGGDVSDTDITRLAEQPARRDLLAQAEGLYARVETGDALFIPKRTWHAVISLAPSISVGVFGLTVADLLTGGVKSLARDWLHALHLYRWGNCTCHRMAGPPAQPTQPARPKS
jgi:lysine-specific demethylase 8